MYTFLGHLVLVYLLQFGGCNDRTVRNGPQCTMGIFEWKINRNWGGDEEEGDGVWHYTKIRFGRRFGLEDQILLGLAKQRFVYIDYLWAILIYPLPCSPSNPHLSPSLSLQISLLSCYPSQIKPLSPSFSQIISIFILFFITLIYQTPILAIGGGVSKTLLCYFSNILEEVFLSLSN